MSCAAHKLAVSRLFLTIEDVDFIRSLVKNLAHSLPTIADIGAGSGTTALSIFAEKPHAKVITIDHNAENVDWAKLALENDHRTDTWEGLVSDSLEAAGLFQDRHFNMILLDTSHEYEATKKEIEAWLPKLKNHGIFWFHDYIGSDVKQAVDEAVAERLLRPISQQGLGWAGRKI